MVVFLTNGLQMKQMNMKTEQFFKVGKNNINYIGDNFQDWFYGVEFEKSTANLNSVVLEKPMLDKEIFERYAPSELTLGDIASNLKKLSKKDFGHIFYVRDKNDELRAVSVHWFGGGWSVSADSVGSPGEWYGGYRVFSRNSLEPKHLETLPNELIINGETYKKVAINK
jgi:hypothetical protein